MVLSHNRVTDLYDCREEYAVEAWECMTDGGVGQRPDNRGFAIRWTYMRGYIESGFHNVFISERAIVTR